MAERRTPLKTYRRKVNILDIMALLVGVSLAVLVFKKEYLDTPVSRPGGPPSSLDWLLDLLSPVEHSVLIGSLALFVVRLRQPRLPLRLLVLQPGGAALAVVAICLAFGVVNGLLAVVIGGPKWWGAALSGGWSMCGPSVAGAWVIVLISRRWRFRDWVDVAAQIVGGVLIAINLLHVATGPWIP
jgi:hypothetical protein